MTKSISKASFVESAPAKPAPAERRIHRIELCALLALFWLALRQHVRARRLLILAALLALPSLIAILIRSTDPTVKLQELEFGLVFLLMPHALVPLTALLYASGMIQDEIEEQTLTYLLIRPLPKWSIYLTKLLATLVVTTLLTGVFTVATYLAIHVGIGDFLGADPMRPLKTAGLFALALAAYCSILGLISLLTRRSLVA